MATAAATVAPPAASTAPPLPARLPEVGTSIFTQMSALAAAHGAINLSQGFPDFGVDPALIALVHEALQQGHNQYAPAAGLPALRQQVAQQQQRQHGLHYDPDTEVSITTGGTAALYAGLAALVEPGDEVIVLDPAYDSYAPAVRLCGGVPVHVPLALPAFGLDLDRIAAALSPRTRALIVNTPHNPSGAVLSPTEREGLAQLAQHHPVWFIADEVYEYLVYDGHAHHGLAGHPALRPRTLTVGSFGKSLHATGWKVGYACAPPALTAALRKVHQFLTFSVHTPTQVAIARYLEARPDYAATLGAFYQQKRDTFARLMAATAFEALPTRGTYFQLYRYGGLGPGADQVGAAALAHWLTVHAGVASIPVSAFYPGGADPNLLRFCFAKQDATLAAAAERLHPERLATLWRQHPPPAAHA